MDPNDAQIESEPLLRPIVLVNDARVRLRKIRMVRVQLDRLLASILLVK